MSTVQAANRDDLYKAIKRIPLRVLTRTRDIDAIADQNDSIQPICIGIPLPQAHSPGCDEWVYLKGNDVICPVQTKIAARWPNGSAKWLLATFLLPEGSGDYELSSALTGRFAAKDSTGSDVQATSLSGGRLSIMSGAVGFEMCPGDATIFSSANKGYPQWLGPRGVRLMMADQSGKSRDVRVESLRVEEEGPVRATVVFAGNLAKGTGLRFEGRLSLFAGTGLVRLELTAHNPRRARHKGGYWDLGDPGSVLLKELSLEVDVAESENRRIWWQEHPDGDAKQTTAETLEIYQESSGGESWQSRNHVNRLGQVPLRTRGYRVCTGDADTNGNRASPVVCLAGTEVSVACAVEEFWQKFPTALEVRKNQMRISLWPRKFGDLYELQAGEQCTRVVWFDFGHKVQGACERLSWVYNPPRVVIDPAWIAASGCIPHFPNPDLPTRSELQTILHEAVEGERSFFAKREVIDEYGWRHFGDMWADHEEAYSEDSHPVISHYNNQYDLLHGLLVQHLSDGDARWWQLADSLARHILDIDIYHTNRDKPGYNAGMFWHTAHYHNVGRCTHRSMSTDMLGKKIPAPGTGPGNEHNYSTGLLLYHHLTGNERARECVIGLADWVLAMDDGGQHVLGVASDLPTGDASRTTESNYHGPGRGAGNSINSLLNGWQLTDDKRYLHKASELVRRTIHPQDDIDARQLGNAELRWSYTVYLQALARFIELQVPDAELADVQDYAKSSLLHYARWMCANERFYLDEPEKLEFPTETWAAQELRKGTTLWMAARYASASEAKLWQVRGKELLDRAWQSLISFDTRGCTRPVALVLQQGYLETSLQSHFNLQANGCCEPRPEMSSSPPSEFIPQKEGIKRALLSPAGWLKVVRSATRPSRWSQALRQTWLAERYRRMFE
jgi:hypothetical protein